MGDVILTTPIVHAVKKKFPGALIDIITSTQYAEIYKFSPYINEILDYDKSLSHKANQENLKRHMSMIRIKKYDLIIDLQNNYRSHALLKGLGTKTVRYKKNNLAKFLLIHFKIRMGKVTHVVDKYFQTIKQFGIENAGFGLELWLHRDFNKGVYTPYDKNYFHKIIITIAPGAHFKTKRWPADNFVALIKKLISSYSCEIILIGGEDDVPLCKYIQSKLSLRIQNLSGSRSILETVDAIENSNVLITNDTGIMHIASARKLPVIALFGSTTTDFGFTPYRTSNIIVEAITPCRPCTHIGRDECPKKHFDCMYDISVSQVFDAFRKIMKLPV
ncbi:MAG: glycosyltransferase family 9 protein [Candidatus Kapabacteria bacterium]|nr:glycosyltransferase family 9 protein [Candidatus Kapabacteria bacterium]